MSSHEADSSHELELAGVTITITSREDADVVSLAGDFDVFSESSVRRVVGDPRRVTRSQVVLDLSRATFLDSSMLKELLRANAELDRYDTKLVLAGITPAVQRVLHLTRTTALFAIAEDAEAALALASADGAEA